MYRIYDTQVLTAHSMVTDEFCRVDEGLIAWTNMSKLQKGKDVRYKEFF